MGAVVVRSLLALTGLASALSAGAAPAAPLEVLATPRLLMPTDPQVVRRGWLVSNALDPRLFALRVLDLRRVQEHPEVRARRDYALLSALPVVAPTPPQRLPVLHETQTWQLSSTVLLTFPLSITGRNLVTAEIAGAGRVAVAPTGFAEGGVLTFTGAF